MDKLINKYKLHKLFDNWLDEIRNDKFDDWEVEYSAVFNCLCAVDDAEEIQVPHWVKVSERKPTPRFEAYIALVSYGDNLRYDLLYYGPKSQGDVYFDEEDGPDYECFYYDDIEYGFTEVEDRYVIYWLDGLEMPNET